MSIETKLIDLMDTVHTVPLGECQMVRLGHTIAVQIGSGPILQNDDWRAFLQEGGTASHTPPGWGPVDGFTVKL